MFILNIYKHTFVDFENKRKKNEILLMFFFYDILLSFVIIEYLKRIVFFPLIM
jgi:hypothetical protein